MRIRLSQSHGPHNRSTPSPPQRILGSFPSFWHHPKPHSTAKRDTQPRSHPLSWTRNLVSGIVRRQDTSKQEPPVVEVPYTAGKPRNYHARKKLATSLSRPPKIYTTQKPSAEIKGARSSSQLPPPTSTASTLAAVTSTAGVMGTPSHPYITGVGWRARFVGWICCMPIQNTDSHH